MNRSRTLFTSLRLTAQWIGAPQEGASAADVIRHMTAMQAQDFAGAKWSVGLRAPGLTDADVEQALANAEIVRSWPMRGTLHLVAPEDLGWMLQLTTPRLIRGARLRREQLGLAEADIERARDVARQALSGGRVLTRDAIHNLWNEHGIETTGQRGYHLLWSLSQTGTLVFGPVQGKVQTFVLLDEWVTQPKRLEGDEALGEWAARYFASHGPATVRDFAWWASLTLGEARRGVAVAKPRELEVDGTTYYLAEHLEPTRGTFLLPGFDEYLLGYQDRSAPLAAEHAPAVVPGNNGIFQPTIVKNGEIVGLWKKPLGTRGFEFSPFATLPNTRKAEAGYGDFMARTPPR
ncbi:winged helix DNA-binding domain-containing protein [Glaciihabitans arcticus]|uniref:Winged helix DNA-binding domain-containing protein n=1 Tax=Glaciihabitans arcticus TaxID=2668039 RepID=A0A4Q9GQQ6_9MICO|nr:winged helix DNA-binding domain-containing protein [Glaciihabitans arcticus]TBN57001.1 winged helix DNA-binding domain-containing protein [Glaciihabitans arcticus]